jgi:pyruvate formate lyase activating enzyme
MRGACFTRCNIDGDLVATAYGRTSGLCIDPVEKKPLNHFWPGNSVLSFGTVGCNLSCRFCQNWELSAARSLERLTSAADPDAIAISAFQRGCRAIAYTYNDPIVFPEYAIDTARAAHELGLLNIAVSAGYINPEPRIELFQHMDAANIDLKGIDERFYRRLTGSELGPVLDTLRYLAADPHTWLEVTNLVIPRYNDSDDDLHRLVDWVATELGPDIPLHFSAFHPDHKMMDVPRTPASTLLKARQTALDSGLHFVYTGNIADSTSSTTYCPQCNQSLVERSQYEITTYRLTPDGNCFTCATPIPGRWPVHPGTFGNHRAPVRV